ncbi:BBE domain-containing protein [Streptomyces sp. NPDC021356]|uniref:BBE domain-containing protein n=1 Tax=Streptomyces sp. NPDC021356 TaxID=3154900 RepID=UPI0034028A00
MRVGHLGPAAEGEQLVTPLRAAAPLLLDTVAERPCEQVGDIHVDPVRAAYVTETTVGLRELTADTLAAFVELTGPESGCPLASVEIRALGGALDREPPVPNSVPSRGIPFVTFAVGVAGPSGAGLMAGHLAAYAKGMAAWGDDRSIMNFLAPDAEREEADVRALFGGQRYDRLAAVKRRYDPRNMFRLNHNVRPA